MSSPNERKQGWLKEGFKRMFMQPAAIPPFLQYFMTLFQFFTFTIFISSNSLPDQSLIFSQVIQRNMLIFLVLLFLLRYLTRLSIIKSIFVTLLVWNVQCQLNIISIIVYILLLIHIIIDIISKVEFSFETKNVHVSTYPWLIIVHYIFMSSLTILRFIDLTQNYVFPLCEIGAVVMMLILQERALYKYVDFKNIKLRFYFLTAFYALAQIYQIFISPQPLWKSVFAIITSQLLHQFIQWKFSSQFTLQQYISKKLQTEAGFYIFSFLYSKKQINKMIIKALKTLANQQSNILMQEKTFKQVQPNNIKKVLSQQSGQFINYINQTKQAAHKLITLIADNPSIYSQLLIAELTLFELDQHVNCRQKLIKLYNKTKWYNIMTRILISKLEKKLLAHLRIQHNKRFSPMFYQFIENDRFRNMLLKSSVNFVELWEYTKVKQGIYKRINQLAEKVINCQDKIRQFYTSLKVKCIKINLLYGSYLFLVQRDIITANQIMQQLYFYQQKQQNIQCDNKIFIKVSIQFSQPLRVQGIGSNVNKHLGYDKRSMIGLAVSNLVPEFYKDDHDKIMADVLQKQPQKMFLYSKSTIIRHAKGNYVVSLFCLRITYDIDGQLSSQGFIKIIQDQRHNWHNFLFVRNNTRDIVQCSTLVNQKISNTKGKRYSAEEFFDNIGDGAYWTRIQKYTSQLNSYYYQPILQFDSNNEKITMFVELDPYAQSIIVHKPSSNGQEKQRQQPIKRKILIPQMIVYPKYRVFDNIKHFLRLKISSQRQLTSLRNNIILLIFIMLILVIGIYIIQGINIINVNSQYNNKIQTMKIFDNILNHYMGLSKIAVDMSYLVVNLNYGYKFQNYNLTLGKDIMTVQATNLYFKQYSINKWPYESLYTTQLYHTCYEFVSEFLASALFVNQIFNDQQIRNNMLNSYGKIFTQTFLLSYSQYTDRIHDQLEFNTQNSDVYQIIKIVILAIIAVVLYIFIIKVENSVRVTQHQTLQFISSLTFQDQIIQKTKQFIHLITEEKVQTLMTSSKGSFAAMGGLGTKQSYPESSKISELSARESTGRDLLGNMSGRETIRTADNPQIETTDQLLAQNSRIKLKPVNKKFILFPLVFLLAILLLQIFNYVVNVKLKEIDESQSEQNIVSWMNKPLFFTRLLNAFLTEDRGPGITDHDQTFYQAYNAFQSSYNNVASFSQTSYAQFSDFSTKLREIQFEYLCTYAACPAFDADYVNILYTTTMQKLAQYMLSNQYFLNDPNNKMNTIIMSDQLFRQIMTNLIQTYISDYQQYVNDYQSSQMMFFIIILVVLGLLTLLLGLQIYFNVYKSFVKHFKIYDIVKEDSYLINKEEMISFQEEELKRQQTEKKNKQGKKKKKKGQDKDIDESRDEQNQHSQNLENYTKDLTGKYSPRGQSKISKGGKMKDSKESKTSAFKNQKQKMKKTSSK